MSTSQILIRPWLKKLTQKWMKIRWWPNGWKQQLKMCIQNTCENCKLLIPIFKYQNLHKCMCFFNISLWGIKKSTYEPTIWHKIIHWKLNVFGLPSRIRGFMCSRFFHFLFDWGGGGGVGWGVEGIQLMQSLATIRDMYPSWKMQTSLLLN